MPGPGPHLMYALASGMALATVTHGRFSPHHTLIYTISAFFNPDIASLFDLLPFFSGAIADFMLHPLFYILIFGLPLCFLYSWLSRFLLHYGVLDSLSGIPLSKKQCLLLVSAGSLSHLFLDHLFQDQVSPIWSMYRNPGAASTVTLVSFWFVCAFFYINRVRSNGDETEGLGLLRLIIGLRILGSLWFISLVYWIDPRSRGAGEETDLGIVALLAIYFFLPHYFCIESMSHDRDLGIIEDNDATKTMLNVTE